MEKCNGRCALEKGNKMVTKRKEEKEWKLAVKMCAYKLGIEF